MKWPIMVERDVLVVTHPLAPASENHVEALLEILAAITSVGLVTANLRADSPIRDKFDVVEISEHGVGGSIPVAALRFVINQFRLCWTIWNRDEEIVLFFGAISYVLPIAFARLLDRTVMLEPRGNVPLTLRLQWEQQVPRPLARGLAGCVWLLERLGYRFSNAIITYTPSMADELGLDRYVDKLYPNGARYVDTEQFYPRVDFADRDHVVGFLGRLDEEKNVRMLATASQHLVENITFRFIGDGELRTELEKELSNEIDSGAVAFTGWIDHQTVPQALSELRLLVLPSAPTEGLPTVILESMACGTPVLANPVSGVPDVVHREETGYLIDQMNVEWLQQKIDRIIESEDLETISETSREYIESEYDFDAAVQRYQRILEAID